MFCFWCLVDSRDNWKKSDGTSQASPNSEIVFGIFTCWLVLEVTREGLGLLTEPAWLVVLAASGTSYRLLSIRFLLSQYENLPPKNLFSWSMKKLKSALVPALPGTALHKGCTLFVSNSGWDPLAERCSSMMTHKLAWWWVAVLRGLQPLLKKPRGCNRFPVSLLLKYWLCEVHGKMLLLLLALDSFKCESKGIWLEAGTLVVESVRARMYLLIAVQNIQRAE